MALSTGDLYQLASDLAAEHGAEASDFAGRAVLMLEAEGNHARAQFWFVMLVMLHDIAEGRVDLGRAITLH